MSMSNDPQTWEVQSVEIDQYLEKGWYSVAINATKGNDELYLEIQLDTDEEERDDGYCIVDSPIYPDSMHLSEDRLRRIALHRTLYGGIEECGLVGPLLYFVLSDTAQDAFGWPRRLELSLYSTMAQLDSLREGLLRVFGAVGDAARPLLRM
ncbi:hypothetical protein QTQ03_00670 [Micromonospora sp. WMMA1363]|uniref:hypothetical protein n=1 Tax=Micromonospora sp. WMMA1363 TaxID=3053985 RepID=UPI00259C68A6|nr:hypothetical protein [Micromonospora sp. WMMA1363]MDM4718174.1 hypothetical protein [Micromonospora sp. WMMA1363]